MEFPNTLTANTDTRAGRMLELGDVRVTVTSKVSGEHVTIRFKAFADNRDRKVRPDVKKNWVRVPLAEASHVFVEVPSADGDWSDKVGTFYPGSGRWFDDRNADPARVWAAAAAAKWLNGSTEWDNTEFAEEERCGACARRLTDPVSIARGIGPECYGKHTGSQHQSKQKEDEERPTLEDCVTDQGADKHEVEVYEQQAIAGSVPLTPAEVQDGHLGDMAEAEVGVNVATLSARELDILRLAVEQEIAIRKHEDANKAARNHDRAALGR